MSVMQFIDLKTQQTAIKPEIDRRIADVLAHGQYIMGPEVAELEAALASFVGSKHCITMASGTEALLIALMALGIGPGDEVITSPFTFVATVEVIALLGATPVFADIEPDTMNIDANLIEALISPRTKAIMPVSLYGQAAELDQINAISARHGNIPVIEDAAQSFGATLGGRQSCGLSTIGCTSFFPSKPLGCYGDGGAFFTNDDSLAQAAREIRVHGQSKRYVHTRIGVGGRMDTLQCAIVLAKLTRFPWEVSRREALGARYTSEILRRVPGARPLAANDWHAPATAVQTLTVKPDRTSVHAQYTIAVPNREHVQAKLQSAGIPTAVHYPVPLNKQPAYRQLCADRDTPVSDWAARHVLSLPMGPDLSDSDMDRVIGAVADAVNDTCAGRAT
jgi:UDP-2-acetamido-2-deoxy-ribo-hexuluronate aminotransferase